MIGKEETKLLQYADDMTAVLCDINSAQALFDLLEAFKSECPLSSSQSWHMMKNKNFSYSSQR